MGLPSEAAVRLIEPQYQLRARVLSIDQEPVMPAQTIATAQVALVASAVLAMSLPATAAPTSSQRPRPEAACIAYDLHVLTLIEDHGLVEDTDPETLRQAAFQMLDARAACRSGDVRRALALYSSIPLGHVPMTPFYRILMR